MSPAKSRSERALEVAELDAEQWAAATSPHPKTACIAIPGSGKTQVLATRITWLLTELKAAPEKIIAFTFTRAAAAELRARVVSLVGKGRAERVTITTFHAWAVAELRKAGWPAFRVASEEEVKAVEDGIWSGPARRPEASRVTRTAFAKCRDHYYAGLDAGCMDGPWGLVNVFLSRMEEMRLLPVGYALMALTSMTGKDDVLGPDCFVGRYDHVLVDEAQDSTTVEMVHAEVLSVGGTLFLALDPRQAIYGWRGAQTPDLSGFERFALTKTRRFGNEIAEHATRAAIEADWGSREPQIVPVRPDAPSSVLLRSRADLCDVVLHLAEQHGPGNVAVLVRTNREAEEIAIDLAGAGALPMRRRDPKWMQIAVLLSRLTLDESDDAAFRALWGLDHVTGRGKIEDVAARAGSSRSLLAQVRKDGWPWGGLLGMLEALTPTSEFGVAAEIAASHTTGLYPDEDLEALGIGAAPLQEALDVLAQREDDDAFARIAADGKVAVSTVHLAKGREWDAVVVATSDRWPFPAFPKKPDPEEQRVYFVAVTRARKELALLVPESGAQVNWSAP